MSEDRTPTMYHRPAIETSSDVAGLLTFKPAKGKGKGPKGGGQGNHS